MNVIKKSDILDCYNYDGYGGSEIIGMIVYEEIPTLKAIPLDKLHKMCDEIKCLDSLYYKYDKYVKVDEVTKIINKYIESEEK
jgi:hypothetical protein